MRIGRDGFAWTVAMMSRIDFAAVYLGLLTRARPPIDVPDGLGRAGRAAQHLPPPGPVRRLEREGVRFVELMHNRIRPVRLGVTDGDRRTPRRAQPVAASAGGAVDRRAPGRLLPAGRGATASGRWRM